MARIHTYEDDNLVRGNDKWIGSDSQNSNQTKNFTADKVASYFSNSGVVLFPNSVTLKYTEWQNPAGSPSGFFWIYTPSGNTTPFSNVSSFGLSKKDLKVRFFDEFVSSIEGDFIYFFNSINPNCFSIYKLLSVEDHPDNSNLLKIDVEFIRGNGFLNFNEPFLFGLLDRKVEYGDLNNAPTNLSEFTNDVGFITIDDIPTTSLLALDFSPHASFYGNEYKAGDVVYYLGRIYKAKFNNDSVLPEVGGNTYWEDLGTGLRLRQVNSDWNSTEGDSLILNKPNIPTKTSDLTNDGEDGVNPFITSSDLPTNNIDDVLVNGNEVTSDTPIIYPDNGVSQTIYQNGEATFIDPIAEKTTSFASLGILHYLNAFLNTKRTIVKFDEPTQLNDISFPNESGTLATKEHVSDNYVPYTGAIQDVDLGEHEIKAGQITLDTSPTGTATVGTTQWNNTIGSSQTTLKGGTVLLKNGVDLVARVVNKVTPNATLLRSEYKAVRVSGAQGQRLAVAYAQANSDNNSADTIGLVCEDIATNQEGFILTVGQFLNINTTGSLQGETWADGDVIYLSPTTAGSLTNIKPNGSTGHIVVIGYVEYAHAIHGSLYVKVMNGWELDELHNVYINTPLNNQGLFYNSTSQLWENKSVSTALGFTPVSNARAITINGTTFDLSANRSWTVGDLSSSGSYSNPFWLTSLAWSKITGAPSFLDSSLIVRKSLASTISTTSVTSVNSNLSFSIDANEVWYVEIKVNSGLGGTPGGGKYQISAPTGCTVEGSIVAYNSTTAVNTQRITAINTLGLAIKTVTLASYFPDYITFRIKAGANAGTVALGVAANSAGTTFAVQAGGTMIAYRTTEV
jgi:hypothetical protein